METLHRTYLRKKGFGRTLTIFDRFAHRIAKNAIGIREQLADDQPGHPLGLVRHLREALEALGSSD